MELKVISEILAEADKMVVSEIKPPEKEIGKNEKEVGILPEYLIKLYGYYQKLSKQINSLGEIETETEILEMFVNLCVGSSFKPEGLSEIKLEIAKIKPQMSHRQALMRSYSLTEGIFWAELRKNHESSDLINFGIRKDWKVVVNSLRDEKDICLAMLTK